MNENLTGTGLLFGLLYKMDFVCWVVECSDVGSRRWHFAVLEHSEVWVLQNLGRVIDLRIRSSNIHGCLGHDCGKREEVVGNKLSDRQHYLYRRI